jgi:cytochrome b561
MREKQGFHFGLVSIINHWVNAVIFIGVLSLGFYLDYVGSGRALAGPWMGAHQAAGSVFLFLAFWRLTWRISQGFPKDIAPMPAWQKFSAELVHWALLFAIIAMPVSGILMNIFSERSINVFGLFSIPEQPENELISRIASTVHESLSYLAGLAIFMHVGAVVKHHIIDRDDTLVRMIKPSWRASSAQQMSAGHSPRPSEHLADRGAKSNSNAA